jgi:hypothetical protein
VPCPPLAWPWLARAWLAGLASPGTIHALCPASLLYQLCIARACSGTEPTRPRRNEFCFGNVAVPASICSNAALSGPAWYQPNKSTPLYLPSQLLQKNDISQLGQSLRRFSLVTRLLQCDCRSARPSLAWGHLAAVTTPAHHDHLQRGASRRAWPHMPNRRCCLYCGCRSPGAPLRTRGCAATHPLPSSFSTVTLRRILLCNAPTCQVC